MTIMGKNTDVHMTQALVEAGKVQNHARKALSSNKWFSQK